MFYLSVATLAMVGLYLQNCSQLERCRLYVSIGFVNGLALGF